MEEKTERRKVKLRIPSKYGNIEVEGSPRDIKILVDMISGKKRGLKKNSIREMIQKMIDDKFFHEPRTLSEIKSELERRGFRYSTSSLFPVIYRYFLRKDIMMRIGEKKSL